MAEAEDASMTEQEALVVSTTEEFWRVQIEAVYRQRNPYKLDRVPQLLDRYRGRQALLYRKVCRQYGLDPTKFYACTGEDMDADEFPDHGRGGLRSFVVGVGSRIAGAAHRLIGFMRWPRRSGADLSDAEDEGAEADAPSAAGDASDAALSPPRRPRESLVQGTPPLWPLGTLFTPIPRSKLKANASTTSADVDGHEIDAPRRAETETAPKSGTTVHVETSADFWRVQLEAIYRKRNPHKLCRVPAFLEKYRGQEVMLYRKVCKQYGLDPTRFYSGQDAWDDEGDFHASADLGDLAHVSELATDGEDVAAGEAENLQDADAKFAPAQGRRDSAFAFDINNGNPLFGTRPIREIVPKADEILGRQAASRAQNSWQPIYKSNCESQAQAVAQVPDRPAPARSAQGSARAFSDTVIATVPAAAPAAAPEVRRTNMPMQPVAGASIRCPPPAAVAAPTASIAAPMAPVSNQAASYRTPQLAPRSTSSYARPHAHPGSLHSTTASETRPGSDTCVMASEPAQRAAHARAATAAAGAAAAAAPPALAAPPPPSRPLVNSGAQGPLHSSAAPCSYQAHDARMQAAHSDASSRFADRQRLQRSHLQTSAPVGLTAPTSSRLPANHRLDGARPRADVSGLAVAHAFAAPATGSSSASGALQTQAPKRKHALISGEAAPPAGFAPSSGSAKFATPPMSMATTATGAGRTLGRVAAATAAWEARAAKAPRLGPAPSEIPHRTSGGTGGAFVGSGAFAGNGAFVCSGSRHRACAERAAAVVAEMQRGIHKSSAGSLQATERQRAFETRRAVYESGG